MAVDENNWCVYKHTNKTNGKVYIGITSGAPENRWANGRKYKGNEHFTSAINKYGWDGFSHEVLCTGLTKEEAIKEEVCLICAYRSADREFGYNISLGGVGAASVSEETRERMRKSASGDRNANYGKPKTEETKKLLSESNKRYWKEHPKPTGWKHTPEARQRMSEALKGRKPTRLGAHLTEEHKEKIRIGVSKPVLCVETGQVFENARIASAETGANYTSISDVCNHKRGRTVAGGYHWKFVE